MKNVIRLRRYNTDRVLRVSKRTRTLAAILTCIGIPLAQAADRCALQLRLIDAYSIPASTRVDGHVFGGISGLDYDARSKGWYLVSDARSENRPAGIFTAEMAFDAHRLSSVTLQTVGYLQTVDAVDAESIRIDPRRHGLMLAGEGDVARHIRPWIRRTDLAGRELEQIDVPSLLESESDVRGPRANRSIEGLAFASHGRALWIAMESPLMQDGPAPDTEHGADVRLTRLQRSIGTLSQYVYEVDAASAHLEGESFDNGISEILALSDNELLVLERSGIQARSGGFRFHTRLYCADITGATNVASFESLQARNYRKAAKRLLLNFDELRGVDADNLEAMGWGPNLGPARRSLVFASDNNLFDDVPTRLLLFEARR